MTAPDERPTPAERVEAWIVADGIELVEADSGRKLITIRHDQVAEFIQQISDAHGASLLATVRKTRGEDQ